MSVLVKDANLLAATEEYIVQQCCCTAVRPHGLSEAIAIGLKVNPYAQRRVLKGNWATLDTRPTPGTVGIFTSPVGALMVACLYAQYTHGKPGIYKDPLTTEFAQNDTRSQRFDWFKECLGRLDALHPKSLAFPYKIGCGLAGGDWTQYLAAIRDWAGRNPSCSVALYKL